MFDLPSNISKNRKTKANSIEGKNLLSQNVTLLFKD